MSTHVSNSAPLAIPKTLQAAAIARFGGPAPGSKARLDRHVRS